jgi:amino acid transporter
MDQTHKPTKRILGSFALSTLGIAAIFSLRNLPISAVYGFSLVTYYIAATFLFLIPSALVCAELSATWPEAGGLYAWVKKAMGPHIGFLAIWFEWVNTIFAFPTMLGFIIFTLLFPYDRHLANNPFYEFGIMVAIYWIITYLNFRGIRTSSAVGAVGVIFGLVLVSVIIIGLGFSWIASDQPIHITFSWHALAPTFQIGTLAFLISMVNSLSGVQAMSYHAHEVKNPGKTFPRSTLIVIVTILTLSVLGSISISAVTSHTTLDLIGGIIQAITVFLSRFHLEELVPLFAVLIAVGVLSEINTWVIGPAKGMQAAAQSGELPKWFAKKNKHGVPTSILLVQGIIGTILSAAYIYMPSVNSAYWLLSDLTAEFTLLMWLLLFTSALVLHYKYSHTKREFRVPGGKFGIWTACILGNLTSFTILVLSYIPPINVIQEHAVTKYESILFGGLVIFLILPIIYTYCRHKKSSQV